MASQAVDRLGDIAKPNLAPVSTWTDRLISRVSRWSGMVLLVASVVSLAWFLLI